MSSPAQTPDSPPVPFPISERELVDDLRSWYDANEEVIKQDLQDFAQAVAEGFRAAAEALFTLAATPDPHRDPLRPGLLA